MNIPGVGVKTAADYQLLGVKSIEDLRDRNPSQLYEELCRIKGVKIDRCVLYQLRCSVYYASNQTHNTDLLKWFNWKDKTYPTET